MREFRATTEPAWAVAFSPDGRYLAAGGGRAGMRLWDTFSAASPITLKDSADAVAAAFLAEGLVLCRRGCALEFRPGPVWKVARLTPATVVYSSSWIDIAPNGRVVQGTHDYLRCWDPVSGELCWDAKQPDPRFNRLACGPGDLIAAVTGFRTLRRWDAATGVNVATGEKAGEGGVLALAFSPDGRTLALSAAHDLILWDVATWAERARVRLPAPCTRLGYRPDGAALFGFTHGPVRVWEPDTLRERSAFGFGVKEVLSLAFAADGHRAAAGCADGRAVVWDLD